MYAFVLFQLSPLRQRQQVSNLVFYAQSTSTVISGRENSSLWGLCKFNTLTSRLLAVSAISWSSVGFTVLQRSLVINMADVVYELASAHVQRCHLFTAE